MEIFFKVIPVVSLFKELIKYLRNLVLRKRNTKKKLLTCKDTNIVSHRKKFKKTEEK